MKPDLQTLQTLIGREIDQLVYKLYELTPASVPQIGTPADRPEEIAIVENST